MFTQCLKYDKGQDGHVLVFVHQAANESRKYIYIYYIYILYIYIYIYIYTVYIYIYTVYIYIYMIDRMTERENE